MISNSFKDSKTVNILAKQSTIILDYLWSRSIINPKSDFYIFFFLVKFGKKIGFCGEKTSVDPHAIQEQTEIRQEETWVSQKRIRSEEKQRNEPKGGSLSYLLGLRSGFLLPWKLQGLTRLWSDIVICRHRSKEYHREGHKQRSFHLCERAAFRFSGEGRNGILVYLRGEEKRMSI